MWLLLGLSEGFCLVALSPDDASSPTDLSPKSTLPSPSCHLLCGHRLIPARNGLISSPNYANAVVGLDATDGKRRKTGQHDSVAGSFVKDNDLGATSTTVERRDRSALYHLWDFHRRDPGHV